MSPDWNVGDKVYWPGGEGTVIDPPESVLKFIRGESPTVIVDTLEQAQYVLTEVATRMCENAGTIVINDEERR